MELCICNPSSSNADLHIYWPKRFCWRVLNLHLDSRLVRVWACCYRAKFIGFGFSFLFCRLSYLLWWVILGVAPGYSTNEQAAQIDSGLSSCNSSSGFTDGDDYWEADARMQEEGLKIKKSGEA